MVKGRQRRKAGLYPGKAGVMIPPVFSIKLCDLPPALRVVRMWGPDELAIFREGQQYKFQGFLLTKQGNADEYTRCVYLQHFLD